jgi:hypothetical protein
MTKAILIESPKGWYIKSEAKGTLFSKKAFKTKAAVNKYIAANWPSVKIVSTESGW